MNMYGKKTDALTPAANNQQSLTNSDSTKISIDDLNIWQRRRVQNVKGRAIESAAKQVFVLQVERTAEIHAMEIDNAAEIYKASRSKLHQEAMHNHRLDTMTSAMKAKDIVSDVEMRIAHDITRSAEEGKAEIESAPVGEDAREYLLEKLREKVQEKTVLADWLGKRMDRALRKSVDRHFLEDDE